MLAVSTSVVGGRADVFTPEGFVGQTYFFLAPLAIPRIRRSLFTTRAHRQLLGVVSVNAFFATWATVGYAEPARFANPVALGTDGIGANMIESFRLAYVLQRSVDVTVGPDPAWSWLETGWDLMPDARSDEVTWSYDPMDPWHIAFTPGIRPLEVKVDGEVVFADGKPTKVDGEEIVPLLDFGVGRGQLLAAGPGGEVDTSGFTST